VPGFVEEVPPGAEPLCLPERGICADEFLSVFDELLAEGRSVTLGPVAPQWCSAAAWEGVAARAHSGARVHTHLLESRAQRTLLQPSPVETLRRFGVLGGRLSAAHAGWLSDNEIADVGAAGATLVHCPGSNRKLAGAAAPVRRWLDAGVTAALGLDSNARAEPPDAFDELRAAADAAEGALTARELLSLATTGGAAALGRDKVGRLAPGFAANVVLLALPQRHADPVDGIVGQATRHDVIEVWAAGELRVEDGRLLQWRAAETARERLRAGLAYDADMRRRRFETINALQPWLSDIWGLETAAVPEGAR
jgi:cytosine/adenosine deaminase-related metal-dependent hydrolase